MSTVINGKLAIIATQRFKNDIAIRNQHGTVSIYYEALQKADSLQKCKEKLTPHSRK